MWIVDGYTTSNGYPYSTRSTLEDATADSRTTGRQPALVTPVEQVNYIRNSVKATVDAYDGTVTLYEWDDQDPVLKTWMKALPRHRQAEGDISADLHGAPALPGGPVQGAARRCSRNYHVSNAADLLQRQDFWRVPDDPTTGTTAAGNAQPPYYVTLQMPGQARAVVLADVDLRADR